MLTKSTIEENLKMLNKMDVEVKNMEIKYENWI
jgi:hypothetical protein